MFKRKGLLLQNKFSEYLFPSIISSMSMMLGAIVDGIIVGKTIGSNAMAAVHVAEPIMLLFQAAFILFGMGGMVAIIIAKGQRNHQKANRLFTVSLLALVVLSALVALVGLLGMGPLIAMICNEQALVPLTRGYLQVLLLGAPFLLVVPGFVFLLRADGCPKLSAAILLLANGVNLVLDLVFINALHMGIQGAALATITGYAVGVIPLGVYWFSKKRTLRLARLQKSDLPLLAEAAGGGITGTVNTLLLTVKTLFINLIVMAVGGVDGMAVFTVCNFSIAFVSMFNSGTTDTMVPLLGMLYGEKDWQGIRYVLRRSFLVVLGCTAASIAILQLFPTQILGLFGITSATQLALGVVALRIFSICLLGVAISYNMMYYLQTIRHRGLSLTISVLRGVALILPLAFLFSHLFGLSGVWCAYVLAEALTILITYMLCRHTARRSAGLLQGAFLFEAPSEQEALYDVSLQICGQDAVDISKQLIHFSQENGLSPTRATLVGLVAEEAIVNITEVNQGGKPMQADILCRISPKNILLNLRDNGKPFDVLFEKEEAAETLSFTSISVMKKIASSLEYNRILGLNNTVIILDRKGEPT